MSDEAIHELYVYGVASAAADLPPTRGIDGAALRLVEADELAAVVSDVAPGELDPTRERLTVHMETLSRIAEHTTVLPMRFGVVLPGEGAVRAELLEGYRQRLEELLAAVEGRAELELRGSFDEEALMRSVLESHPDIQAARQALEGRPPDATYFERIRLGEQVAAAVGGRREELRARTLELLAPLAVDTRVSEPAHELDAVSAAFLVDAERVPAFDDAVQQLDRDHGDLVRLKYFGPLPPHSFVDLEGDVPAWA